MFTKFNFKEIITLILIIGVFILAAIIIYPIIIPIIYGILFAYIFYPVYRFVLKVIKNKNLSAFLICFGLFVILILIFALFFESLFRQAINFYLYTQKTDFVELAEKLLPKFLSSSDISTNVISYINTYISSILADSLKIFRDFIWNVPILILKLFIVIFVFFFSLRDGEKAVEYIKSLSPLKKETEDRFFKHLKDITSSVLLGHILVGFIQGIVAGVGYFIFGVPNYVLLTVLTMIMSVIPLVGAWIIWVPVDIYLFLSGDSGAGIGLLIYGLFFVSTIDNVIRLIIVSRRTQISSVIVLIGMIGGLFVFGFLGLIIGPLALAYVLLIVELYRKNTLSEELIFTKQE